MFQVYHDLIPVVVALLKGDRALVQRALLLGSLLPLAMFLGWNFVALAQPHLDLGGPLAGRWDPVQQLMESGGLAVGTAVSCFSVLAITTSFLGAALGATHLAMNMSRKSLTVNPLGWYSCHVSFPLELVPLCRPCRRRVRVNSRAEVQIKEGGLGPNLCAYVEQASPEIC